MNGAGAVSFLGVERSLCGRRWRLRDSDERVGLALAQRNNLPEIVGRLVVARGIGLEDADSYLKPTLRDLLPDPSHLRDMDTAVARLVAAVRAGEPIVVFGDYDVDGATSSALLVRFFRAVGVEISVYIPDRLREGYGPNAPALLRLADSGARVVVTVDCGVSAFEPLAAAAEAGLDVIVIDHHAAEPRLPTAAAVVNPNRLDETSPYRNLAAVGLAFLLAVALNRALRQAGWYATRPEPDLRSWLDLVALGTVCDVVPLTGLNRAYVAQGLKVMSRRANCGLAALADVAGVAERPTAYHAGFVFGPRVNAGGRIGQAGLGAELLATEDPARALDIARSLDAYNRERQEIEAACLEQAIEAVEAEEGTAAAAVFVAREGWHAGVIGIVASRLVERYNRPACVVALNDGVGKGSGRSVRGIDLGAAIIAARQQGLIVNGGGHAMAAGFTIAADGVAALAAFLSERIAGEAVHLQPELRLDGAIQPAAATPDFVRALECLSPFGVGNERPRFAFPAVRIVKADVVGTDHVRCIVAGEDGKSLKAIAFRSVESALGQALLSRRDMVFHVAGTLRPDNWNGRDEVQLVIDDAAAV